jgi:hypothetical protein
MINELGSMYSAWNASGNGDDQHNCSSSDMDDLDSTDDSISALQGGDRLSFRVLHRHPSVMYIWFSLMACGLWNAACIEFPEEWKGSGSKTSQYKVWEARTHVHQARNGMLWRNL